MVIKIFLIPLALVNSFRGSDPPSSSCSELCAARPPGGAITAGGPGAVRERPQPAGPGTARPRAWGATRSAGRQALRRAH